MIDDSALFHAGTYDPQKAHEYYLRKRKLKGRSPAVTKAEFKKAATGNEGTYARPAAGKKNRADTASRRAQLKAQKAALEKRLETLKNALELLVNASKKRSGVEDKAKDADKSESKIDKADRNAAEKDLTPAQKQKKAKAAKEAYEKEHPNSLSQDVEVLKEQIADIQAKIKDAIAASKEREKKKAGTKDSIVRPNPNSNVNRR